MLKIETAQQKDYELVLSILTETAEWLAAKGSSQWSDLLSGKDVHNTQRAIERNEVYLVKQDQQVMGMFVLWDEQSAWDKTLWGIDESHHTYYLHRITLTKNAHGKNLGKSLMEAALEISRIDQKEKVRLDCMADNLYLNTFYKKSGFKLLEVNKKVPEVNDNAYNLYEIQL